MLSINFLSFFKIKKKTFKTYCENTLHRSQIAEYNLYHFLNFDFRIIWFLLFSLKIFMKLLKLTHAIFQKSRENFTHSAVLLLIYGKHLNAILKLSYLDITFHYLKVSHHLIFSRYLFELM